MKSEYDIGSIARQFQVDGEFLGAYPHGSGHINDSYCVTFRHGVTPVRYLLQRINHSIFKSPAALMENIERVTSHLARKLSAETDAHRMTLALNPARGGMAWYVDAEGNYWRMYRFIEGARTYDAVESTEQAFQAAKAFGRFQRLLIDLPPPRLHDTIEDFHNTPRRFTALEQAIASDVAHRSVAAGPEIEFAVERGSIASVLQNANLPERIAHNDTKLNNVMFDDITGEGICVIDLDTVMPGLALHDFGDMVRTATSPAKEDEQDLSRVTMQFSMFEALLRGYLASAGDFLTAAEKQHLVFSTKLLAFEQGIRFLTDYLQGDTYYKVNRSEHNLHRCRTQFQLLRSIEQQEEKMHRLMESLGQ